MEKIRPIRTRREYKRVLRDLDELWGSPEGSEAADVAEVLIALVAKYEHDTERPIELPSPVGAIRFRLDQLGLDESALEGVIGSRTRVWEVLNGRRELSLAMIRALHDRFDIPLEPLIKGTRRVAN